MAYSFDITVSATLEDSDLIHRVLHFKEDLHRECYRDRDITVSDPRAVDVALMPVSFAVTSKAALVRFTQVIKKSMARHDVGNAVQVVRR